MRFLLCLYMLSLLLACRQTSEPTVEFVENKQMLPPNERWGELFEAVQLSGIFPDSKTFVDCTPKYPTDQIMSAYSAQKGEEGFDLKDFVLDNFDLPKEYTANYQTESEHSVREHIEALWPVLLREPDASSPGSLISLPNAYIVPGGRFREIYYWDSYFTMLGLRVSQKLDVIENMLDNFAYLIDTIGFIPNGNRTYYLTRSQPPFFPLMVGLYAFSTRDSSVYVRYLPQMRKEYDFWMNGVGQLKDTINAYQHVVRMPDGSILNRYYDRGDYPRAESYREDIETARRSGRPAPDVYRDLRAAAASGWDFSSRWFADAQNLHTIHTTDIIAVDLNALLYQMEEILSLAYQLADEDEESAAMRRAADRRVAAITRYCWDKASGYFRDYDFRAGAITPVPSLAGMYPLFIGFATEEQAAACANMVETTFLQPGGVRATANATGQQWDAPNGWAPLQWVTIQGLRRYGREELAHTILQNWVGLVTKVYGNTGKLLEKYNVSDLTLEAGGGEYPNQDGFGWTNGVLLRLLAEEEAHQHQ